MVDSQDRLGTFNLTNTTMNGEIDEGKAAKLEAKKPKEKKKRRRLEAVELTPEE